MRFLELGPAIPNDLLDARDAGAVVYLCGAGISIPAGLPDFFELTLKVSSELALSEYSELAQIIATERSRRSRPSDPTSPQGPTFDQIFRELKKIFGTTAVESKVARALRGLRKPHLNYHRGLIDLARGSDGRVRLVTTNFDRLFQKAQPKIRTYNGPLLPDLSTPDGFDGVVHLHGIIPARPPKLPSQPLNLILSSADFGRAYLSDGWATRFVSDLLDYYIVVLVGYSASDPPVQYLLEGLHLSGRIDERRLYAFVAGGSNQVEAQWRDRGVTPIVYNPAEGHRHLWESIDAWAARARSPEDWRRETAHIAVSEPDSLRPFQRGQVFALCSSNEGARIFASTKPPPSPAWLCVFDNTCRFSRPARRLRFADQAHTELDPQDLYGLDDDPPRLLDQGPGQELPGVNLLRSLPSDNATSCEMGIVVGRAFSPLNIRLAQLASWAISVCNSPKAIWWAAGRGPLHGWLRDQISLKLDREQNFSPMVRKAWRLVLEAQEGVSPVPVDGWWSVKSQLSAESWSPQALRAYAQATRPGITFGKSWSYPVCPPEDDNATELSSVVHLDVHYPKLLNEVDAVPDNVLTDVIQIIRHHLELGAELEREVSPYQMRLPTLYPEQKDGEHILSDDEDAYLTYAHLFRRLVTLDKSAASREMKAWAINLRFFQPLHIYALANPDLANSNQVGQALKSLSRDAFWDSSLTRELLRTFRARWNSLSRRDRSALERKLLQGRTRFPWESKSEHKQRRSSLSAARLLWMRNAGLTLSPATMARIPELVTLDPNWRENWAEEADSSLDSRGGVVQRLTDPTPLSQIPTQDVISYCDRVGKRDFQSFRELDPFRGLVQEQPQRALAVLTYEKDNGRYPGPYWSRLLQEWPPTAPSDLLIAAAQGISSLPSSVSFDLRFELSRWIERNLELLDKSNRQIGWICVDAFIDAMARGGAVWTESAVGERSSGGREIPTNRMGLDYAINSPSGCVTDGLLTTLFSRRPHRNQEIPSDIASRIDMLLRLEGEGPVHTLCMLCSQLQGLFLIDRQWCRETILPQFNPALPLAEAAWSGLLALNSDLSTELFRELKNSFLLAFSASSRWTDRRVGHLAHLLVLALESTPRRLVTWTEARQCLRTVGDDLRAGTISFLRRRANSQQYWNRLVLPFFRQAWPRERELQSPATSREIILLLRTAGDLFPDAVRSIDGLITAVDENDFLLRTFSDSTDLPASELVRKYPKHVLHVLGQFIGPSAQRAPYDLSRILEMLHDIDPEIRYDFVWQRLHHLVTRSS